jgi:hypothetical protein
MQLGGVIFGNIKSGFLQKIAKNKENLRKEQFMPRSFSSKIFDAYFSENT